MHHYLVSYDIADDKRRSEVAEVILSFGQRIQWSVYSCLLSAASAEKLRAAIIPLIHHVEDQVLFVDLGPLQGRGATCIASVGRPYGGPKWEPFII